MQICMCTYETCTKKGVHVGMCMWEVIPCEGIQDLHNQHKSTVLYKTEYLCSRGIGCPVWGLLMCFWKTDNPIILSSLKKKIV